MMSRSQQWWVVALVLADIVISIGFLVTLPSKVPAHWNWRGEIDRYGSPWEMTLVLSLCLMWVPLLMMAMPKMQSAGTCPIGFGNVFGRFVVGLTALMIAIHIIIMISVSERSITPIAGVPIAFGVLWTVIGNWMGKIRRNWLMGIRTPWTLKNDVVWERTHRIGGRLMVAHGLAIILAGILLPAWAAFTVMSAGLVALVVWAMVYSWWITPRASVDQRFA